MADEAFASVDDLEARWRPLTDTERRQAGILLEDASDLIRAECPRWKQATGTTRRRITCAVVKRAMQGQQLDAIAGGYPMEPRGTVSAETHTTGPFADSFTYANPDGALFLRAAEARALGGRRGGAYEADVLAAQRARQKRP